MKEKLFSYVASFNEGDAEYYKQDIPNDLAAEFLYKNVPLIDIPDKEIERIYYFRFWTLRKHIKTTEEGKIITEFLPPVPWADRHNAIIAAVGHQIAEVKWLACGKELIEDYVSFWLSEPEKTYLYSSWMIAALYSYCEHMGDFSFGIKNLDRLVRYYGHEEREHKTESGLFWSIDNNDAMEFSISGTAEDLTVMRGLRPTLNSYMAANALAISRFAALAGKQELSKKYLEKHEKIKERLNSLLWHDGFYQAIHTKDLDHPSFSELPDAQSVRELIGYIPWCFCLPPKGRESAFSELKKEDGFLGRHGFSTAVRRHARYLYPVAHECLWNGYVWPFATSQVLLAMNNLIRYYEQSELSAEDYYGALLTYARSHVRTLENGEKVPWIDEVIHPESGSWSSRDILEKGGFKAELGGLERGKDYNHSTFADCVLSGLLGIRYENGSLSVDPLIPSNFDYFAVENLSAGGRVYSVYYDRTGEKYCRGKGIRIIETKKR